MTAGPAPVCLACLHFWDDSYDPMKCDAFPKEIPDIVILGGDKHTEKLPGDHGLQYEKGTPQDREK